MLLLFKGLLRDPIRRPIAVVLAAALCLLIVVPQPAHAQFEDRVAAVIAAAGAVVNFINKTIGPLFDTAISSLKDINKVTLRPFSDLWQKIVYPPGPDQAGATRWRTQLIGRSSRPDHRFDSTTSAS